LGVVGYEGLSRFPDGGAFPPQQWFADAFAVGLGPELEWLAAMSALGCLDALPADTFLAIKMSPATILYASERGLCPPDACSRVVIELTEHVPIEDYSVVQRALETVRSLGARLAADDLGSGYAGFRHLVSLRPDIIKLDQSLVRRIHSSTGQRALAAALVAFARDVGAHVIAEGVEEPAELDTLRSMGVPWAQGYHLGDPEPLALVTG
jgi:EAL domain-containing protein (putative c-di-GMP-specific phosphodiesterase class I)